MDFSDRISAVEAILFAYGDPVPVSLLSQSSGIEKQAIPKIIQLLNDRYDDTNSSLYVLTLADSYQLSTRKKYSEYVKKAFETGKNSALSQAATETLAIIAYNQPVTKSFVESVRGIDSASVIIKLTEKGLIEEAERLEVPGRPIAYRTTENFLRCFGLSSLKDLPGLSEKEETGPLLENDYSNEVSDKTAEDSTDDLSDSAED